MFVKKWPFEHQKVIKTYLCTYLRDSSDRSDSSDSSDSIDNIDIIDSSDCNESSDSSDKSCKLSTKNHATSPQKNLATSPKKHCANAKRCPENIPLVVNVSNCAFQITKKILVYSSDSMAVVTVWTLVRKITQPVHKKWCNLYFFLFSFLIKTFSVLLEIAIWHIWQPMFDVLVLTGISPYRYRPAK